MGNKNTKRKKMTRIQLRKLKNEIKFDYYFSVNL